MMGGTFLGLVSQESVQNDLNLTQDQISKIEELREKTRAEMSDRFSNLGNLQSPQERRAKMTQLFDELDQQARKQLRDVLSQEQMMRLYQIRLQVRGPVYGLNNPYVAQRLELTDQQKQKAAELEKATQEKYFDLFSQLRDLSQEQRREKMAQEGEKIRKEADEKALALLTPEQKEALTKMEGKKLEL